MLFKTKEKQKLENKLLEEFKEKLRKCARLEELLGDNPLKFEPYYKSSSSYEMGTDKEDEANITILDAHGKEIGKVPRFISENHNGYTGNYHNCENGMTIGNYLIKLAKKRKKARALVYTHGRNDYSWTYERGVEPVRNIYQSGGRLINVIDLLIDVYEVRVREKNEDMWGHIEERVHIKKGKLEEKVKNALGIKEEEISDRVKEIKEQEKRRKEEAEKHAGGYPYANNPGVSSKRYKTNIKTFSPDTSLISYLHPKKYCYKKIGEIDVGYIAEELDEIGLKDFVVYDKSGRPNAIKYDRLVLLAIEAIKKQQKEIILLKKSKQKNKLFK